MVRGSRIGGDDCACTVTVVNEALLDSTMVKKVNAKQNLIVSSFIFISLIRISFQSTDGVLLCFSYEQDADYDDYDDKYRCEDGGLRV